jgi:nucleotide-binding universal stress UspA family protein
MGHPGRTGPQLSGAAVEGATNPKSEQEHDVTNTEPGAMPRIVVGVDGSPSSEGALWWAARYGALASTAVEAIISWEWPTSYGTALMLPPEYDPQSDAEKVVDAAVAPVREQLPAVTITTVAAQGHPALSLVEASIGAHLLVVGSRGHGELGGILLGSVSQHCAAHAHCPVLVYRNDSE